MKLKDYFTLGNLLCGFASVVALFHDQFQWACYLIFIGYAFDVLDGPVARLTKQFDQFGGFFDEVSDYITNSIAVSFIIYYAFWRLAGFPWQLAAVIGAFPFAFGTIRQAKSMELQQSYPCYWLGVPRPVSAIFLLALLNSSVFSIGVSPWREVAHWGSAGMVVLLSILHLSRIPFVNHHDRRWMGLLRFGMLFFLVGSPLSLVVGWLVWDWPGLIYEWILYCMLIYFLLNWTAIPRADYQRIRAYLAGGALELPLVHKQSSWRSQTLADYFLAHKVGCPQPAVATAPGRLAEPSSDEAASRS